MGKNKQSKTIVSHKDDEIPRWLKYIVIILAIAFLIAISRATKNGLPKEHFPIRVR